MLHKKLLRKKFHWRWLTWPPVVTFSIIFIIYLIVSLLFLDPDFGWHLQSGNYFLAHGIPATDVFTYTANNFPWVDHEWLGDVFVSIMYSSGGFVLLSVIYASIWTFTIWLVGRKAHNLTLILAVLATVPFAGVRAIAWSALGLALLFVIVNAKDHRIRWFIPLLFLAWANLHGSFVIGFAYLLYESMRRQSWKLVAYMAIAALVSLINPYGFDLYTEIIRTLSDSSLRWRITEWGPLDIPWVTIPFVLLWMCGFQLTGYKDWRKYLGIDMIFFIAGVASMRNLVLFTIVSIGITDTRLRSVAKIIPKNIDKRRRRFIVVVGIIITLFILAFVVHSYRGTSMDKERVYPKNAVAYLQKHPCSGNLFNDYNFGGYLIWKLPSQKVYIDGRMPSWAMNGHKYMDEYVDILKNPKTRDKKFKQYNIQCVILSKSKDNRAVIKELIKAKWVIKAKEPSSVFFLKPK